MRHGPALLALLLAGAAAASEVELRHGNDVVDHGIPDWSETSLRVEWSPPSGPGLAATSSRIERFGFVDFGFAAAAHVPLGARWHVAVEGAGSATHHVIPAWGAGAGVQCRLGRGVAVYGGLRGSRYEGDVVSTEVGLGHLGVEYYRGPYRFAWTTHVSRLEGTWASSHAAAWDLFYAGRNRIGVIVSAGRELESLGGGRVLATDVLGAAAVGRTALRGAWSLTYGMELQRQGEIYSRAGGRLGLVHEF